MCKIYVATLNKIPGKFHIHIVLSTSQHGQYYVHWFIVTVLYKENTGKCTKHICYTVMVKMHTKIFMFYNDAQCTMWDTSVLRIQNLNTFSIVWPFYHFIDCPWSKAIIGVLQYQINTFNHIIIKLVLCGLR